MYSCTHAKTCKNNSNSSHETLVTHAILDTVVVSGMMDSFSWFFFQSFIGTEICISKFCPLEVKVWTKMCLQRTTPTSAKKEKRTLFVVSKRQEKDFFFTENANVELIIYFFKNLFQNKEIFYEEHRGAIM